MILAFTLTMPGRASWNGRWSGEKKLYVRTRTFRGKDAEAKARRVLDGGSYDYRWPDGWCADVAVAQVDSREAARLRRKSAGFCSYDWMINSILKHGRIVTASDLAQEAEEEAAHAYT